MMLFLNQQEVCLAVIYQSVDYDAVVQTVFWRPNIMWYHLQSHGSLSDQNEGFAPGESH